MLKQVDRKQARARRHRRVRLKVRGTGDRPRLSVYRSLQHTYAQLIDDSSGRTLIAASTLSSKQRNNATAALDVGKAIAERARTAGITRVVFDRGGYLYHGRIKALADAAREAGLEF